jgi:hypothetical protein
MGRSKPGARDALLKLREQQSELEREEARLRDAAAAELGRMLIACGAETIEPARRRKLITCAMTLGTDAGLRKLEAS